MGTKAHAGRVFLLMGKEYRISRSIRAQWFFQHLDKPVHAKPDDELVTSREELEVLSVLPEDPSSRCSDNEEEYYLVPSTKITFIGRQYRFVFCIDLSPSAATVDVDTGKVLVEEIYEDFSNCMHGLVEEFCVPGSNLCLRPDLFVTVMAHSTISFKACQVLVQGYCATKDNVNELVAEVCGKLHTFEDFLAEQLMKRYEQTLTTEAERGIHSSRSEYFNPEGGLFNMIRDGLLALQLLPDNASAGLIIITDGVFGFENASVVDAALAQMRANTVVCSFLQVGKGSQSSRHGFGYISHSALMQFLATATSGAYVVHCDKVTGRGERTDDCIDAPDTICGKGMNKYHQALYCWNFQRDVDRDKIYAKAAQGKGFSPGNFHSEVIRSTVDPCLSVGSCLLPLQPMQRLKHSGGNLNAKISSVLSVRLREGYSIDKVAITKDGRQLEVKLILPWKEHVLIEYIAKAKWGEEESETQTHFEVFIGGSYDFLIDVTRKQGIISPLRKLVVQKFEQAIKELRITDDLLVRLQSFAINPIFYTIPDSARKGVPLFYLPPGSGTPVLSLQQGKSRNSPASQEAQFAVFWKPVLNLDTKVWQKWFHCHRISLLLANDWPLSRKLFIPSGTDHYTSIQCRLSVSVLHRFLREWSSFVLLETYSYIRFMTRPSERAPYSFCILRLVFKGLCVVLRLAFLGGTPGTERHLVVSNLKKELAALKVVGAKTMFSPEISPPDSPAKQKDGKAKAGTNERACLALLNKPLERMLIKYDAVPNFGHSITDLRMPGTAAQRSRSSMSESYDKRESVIPKRNSALLSMLSSYMYNQRWVWQMSSDNKTSLSHGAIANILFLLTQLRLFQGFQVCNSTNGIITMVKEVLVEVHETGKSSTQSELVVQYVLFPPRQQESLRLSHEESAESDISQDNDANFLMVTELWIEPQYGSVVGEGDLIQPLNGVAYHEIPAKMFPTDLQLVKEVVTYSHLESMCGDKLLVTAPEERPRIIPTLSDFFVNSSTHEVPFPFDIPAILKKSKQVLEFYPMLKETQVVGEEPGPNHLLIDLFHDALTSLNDCATPLTKEESIAITKMAIARCSTLIKTHKRPGLMVIAPLEEDLLCSVQWRCYIRAYNGHLLITVVPLTFEDVERIRAVKCDKDADDGTEDSNDLAEDLLLSVAETYEGDLWTPVLPVIIYQCDFASISTVPPQLLSFDDIIQDFTDTFSESTMTPSDLRKAYSSKTLGSFGKPGNLCSYCSSLYDRYFLTFVNAVFVSLREGFILDTQDVESSVEMICEETCIEVDISGLSKMLCSHWHTKGQEDSAQLGLDESHCKILCRKGKRTSSGSGSTKSSRTSTLTGLSCKHEDVQAFVKERFRKYLHLCFSDVPNNDNLLYYSIELDKNHFDDDAESQGSSEPEEDEFNRFAEADATTIIEIPKDFVSASLPEDLSELSLKSVKGSTISDMDELENMSAIESEDLQNEIKPIPLFLLLTCSVKDKSNMGTTVTSFPLDTLPTCLGDVVKSLGSTGTLLNPRSPSLVVTLDLICLTLPLELDSTALLKVEDSTSFVRDRSQEGFNGSQSHTSEPEVFVKEFFALRKQQESSRAIFEGDEESSYIGTNIQMVDPIKNLPKYQQRAVRETVQKIEFLLEDEIASALRSVIPVTFSTLERVAKHISVSKADNCRSERIPLRFVFGLEKSLQLFLDRLEQLRLDSYCLKREGSYYYLTLAGALQEVLTKSHESLFSGYGMIKVNGLAVESKTFEDNVDSSENSTGAGGQKHSQIIAPEHGEAPYALKEVTNLKHVLRLEKGQGLALNDEQHKRNYQVENHEMSTDVTAKEFKCNEEDLESQMDTLTSEETVQSIFKNEGVALSASGSEVQDPLLKPTSVAEETEAAMEIVVRSAAQMQEYGCDQRSRAESPQGPQQVECKSDEAAISHGTDASSGLEGPNVYSRSSIHGPKAGDFDVSSGNLGDITRDNTSTLNNTYSNLDLEHGVKDDLVLATRRDSLAGPGFLAHRRQCSEPAIKFSDFVFSKEPTDDEESVIQDLIDEKSADLDFWLFLQLQNNEIEVFYHTRTMDSEEDDQRHEILYTKLIHSLEITCRVVNQMMLLNDLYETMTCHNLLVAEEDEQIWALSREKSASKPILFTTHKQDKDNGMPFELGPVVHGEFEFRPGHFECDCVWNTHLPVHFRLKSSPGQQRGTSRGIQAVRAVLNRFSVTNRTNLFVFRESSGNVFYFRIFESIYVYDNLVPSTPNRPPVPDEDVVKDENLSLHSCASSMWSLTVRGYHEGTDDPELADAKFKRTSSFVNAGEKDSLSEHSLTGSSQVSDETIQFIVYGIAEPGREIKVDLIKVLQSRLDDATLEQLNLLLARNPKCRLAPADVHFIQPPAKPPISALCFDIPAQVRPFTHSMMYYLRQNLLLKFHTPRFGEASPDFHFKNYSDDLSSCVSPEVFSSNDVYLYNKRGTKGIGIGCIHLSLVDGEGGDIVVPPKYPHPRYEVNNADYFPSVLKAMLDVKQVQNPIPDDENAMFLRFRVWGRGDIGVKDIKKCVSAAIRHSICDVFMEYFLMATSNGLVPSSQIHLLRFQSRSPSVSSQRSGGPNLKGLITHSYFQGNQRTWPMAISSEALTHKGRLSEPSTPASLTSRSPPFHAVDRPSLVGLDLEHDSGRCTPDVDVFDRPMVGDVETPLSEHRGIAQSPTSASTPVDCVKEGLGSVRRVSPSHEQRLQQKSPLVEQLPTTEEPNSRATSPFDTLTDREVEESLKAMNDQSDHGETKAKPDVRVTDRKESTWQEIELQRRRESFRKKERRKFETGDVGELHPCFSSDATNTFELLLSESYVSLFKFEGALNHSYCVDVVLKEVIKILVDICPDMKPKVFQKVQRLDDDGVDSFLPTFKFAPFGDRTALKVEEKCESSLDSSRQQLFFVPGHKCHYIILGRNMAQWRACMGICEENSEDEMDGPKAASEESSKQRFKGLDPRCTSASLSKTPENCPPTSVQMAFVPRQKLFHVELHDRKLVMYSYNLSTDVTASLEIQLSRLIAWHCARGHLQSCLFMQKLGLFHHTNFINAKHSNQETANFCSSANHQHLVYLMKETAPPARERLKIHENENMKVVTNTLMPTFDDMFYDTSPPRLLQNAGYRFVKDVVKRSGHQYQEVRNVRLSVNALNSKLYEVFETWQQRGSHIPISEDRLCLLKRQSRLVHFCTTPFLFTKPQYASEEDAKAKAGKGKGNSPKEEGKASKGDKTKESSAETQNADQDSHEWLGELVRNFTQQYIKYLQTLGMCLIQLVPSSKGFGRDGGSKGRGAGKRSSTVKSGEETRPGMLYLQKTSPGGIILLELEFKESAFSVKIYGLESVRVKPLAWTVSTQDTLTFLDECAKFKDYAHLHSFSYDFHLRNVQQFLAGRHSILYPGYPVNKLLQYIRDEHPQPPHFACCLLGEGAVSVPCTPGLSTTEVYHYLTLNCKRHDLSVVKGKRSTGNAGFLASESLLSYMYTTNREQLTVDVRKVQANWRDGVDFDGTVVISHCAADDREVINIQYFVLLTSRRDFYPRLSLFGQTSSLKRLRKRAISGSESGSKLYVDDTALSGYPKPRVRFTMTASEPGRKTEFTVLDAPGSTGPIRVPTWPGSFPSEIPSVPKTEEKLSCSGSETMLSSSQQVFTTAVSQPPPPKGSPGNPVLKRSESSDSDAPHGLVLVWESGMSGATITENYVTTDCKFLLEEISRVRRRLKDTVCSCLSNCWRDVIWYEILLGDEESSAKKAKRKAIDGHKDSVNNGFLSKWEICRIISAVRTDACKIASFSCMKMLLELVTVLNFDKIDPRINMAFTLLQAPQKRAILRSVATRFSPYVRTFTSDDLQTTYLCILNPSHCDMFTLLVSDEKGIDIRMVYREKSSFRIAEPCRFDELLSPDQMDVGHVEEVVSCLCFTIWSRLIRT